MALGTHIYCSENEGLAGRAHDKWLRTNIKDPVMFSSYKTRAPHWEVGVIQ